MSRIFYKAKSAVPSTRALPLDMKDYVTRRLYHLKNYSNVCPMIVWVQGWLSLPLEARRAMFGPLNDHMVKMAKEREGHDGTLVTRVADQFLTALTARDRLDRSYTLNRDFIDGFVKRDVSEQDNLNEDMMRVAVNFQPSNPVAFIKCLVAHLPALGNTLFTSYVKPLEASLQAFKNSGKQYAAIAISARVISAELLKDVELLHCGVRTGPVDDGHLTLTVCSGNRPFLNVNGEKVELAKKDYLDTATIVYAAHKEINEAIDGVASDDTTRFVTKPGISREIGEHEVEEMGSDGELLKRSTIRRPVDSPQSSSQMLVKMTEMDLSSSDCADSEEDVSKRRKTTGPSKVDPQKRKTIREAARKLKDNPKADLDLGVQNSVVRFFKKLKNDLLDRETAEKLKRHELYVAMLSLVPQSLDSIVDSFQDLDMMISQETKAKMVIVGNKWPDTFRQILETAVKGPSTIDAFSKAINDAMPQPLTQTPRRR